MENEIDVKPRRGGSLKHEDITPSEF